jgi:hypothetical protein
MAFTGSAVVQQISDQQVRITGIQLLAAASGTIGLFGDSGADVQLPDGFNPEDYSAFGQLVGLSASLVVQYNFEAPGPGQDPLGITKGGSPFRITVVNPNAQLPTAGLEFYVSFHD